MAKTPPRPRTPRKSKAPANPRRTPTRSMTRASSRHSDQSRSPSPVPPMPSLATSAPLHGWLSSASNPSLDAAGISSSAAAKPRGDSQPALGTQLVKVTSDPLISQLIRAWIENEQATDPVFSSARSIREAEDRVGKDIQPFDHCLPLYYPTVARRYGFRRWLPSKLPEGGSRGPTCRVEGQTQPVCHKAGLPAFLYERDGLVCPSAHDRGFPTLVFRYAIGPDSQLRPNACWCCYTNVISRCPVSVEKFSPTIDSEATEQLVVGAQVRTVTSSSPAILASEDREPTHGDDPNLPPSKKRRMALQAQGGKGESMKPERQPSSTGAGQLESPQVPQEEISGLGLHDMSGQQDSMAASSILAADRVVSGDSVPDGAFKDKAPSQRRWREFHHRVRSKAATSPAIDLPDVVSLGLAPELPSRPAELSVLPSPAPTHSLRDATTGEPDDGGPAGILSGLRSTLEQHLAAPIAAAKVNVETVAQIHATSLSVVGTIFDLCDRLREAAERDRAAINDVRQERDQHAATLRTFEGRIGHYAALVQQNDRALAETHKQIKFLSDELEKGQKEQSAVEQRMIQATVDRDQALKDVAQALAEKGEAVSSERKMAAERDAALAFRAEAEAAMDDAELEVAELKAEIEARDREILQLRAGFPASATDRVAPSQTATVDPLPVQTLSSSATDIRGDEAVGDSARPAMLDVQDAVLIETTSLSKTQSADPSVPQNMSAEDSEAEQIFQMALLAGEFTRQAHTDIGVSEEKEKEKEVPGGFPPSR